MKLRTYLFEKELIYLTLSNMPMKIWLILILSQELLNLLLRDHKIIQ